MPRTKPIDMAGDRFGRLRAVELAGWNNQRQRLWRCECDCGGEAVVAGIHLRSGHTQSCGCLKDLVQSRGRPPRRSRPPLDMAGVRFGRIKVTGLSHIQPRFGAYWHCECDCGGRTVVLGKDLRAGKTQSCGCFRNESSGGRTRTHGMSKTRAYGAWQSMLMRCHNPNAINYCDYGALGIKVCARWWDFANFNADVGERPSGKSLDRRNPFGDYEPGNWRWATQTEQRLNTRGRFALRMIALLEPSVRQALYDQVLQEES